VKPDRRRPRPPAVDRAVVLFFVASGAAGLIYQLVWSRELVLVFGNTTQAISTIVTAVMAGLGIGGFAGGQIARRGRNLLRTYGRLEVAVGLLALLLPMVFGLLGEVYRGAYARTSPEVLALIRFALAFAAVTPATTLMGMTLPVLAAHMVRTVDEAGARVGQLYAANTLGAAVGTLLAAFFLIEFLGLVLTSYIAVALNVGVGVLSIVLSRATAGGPPRALADPSHQTPTARPSHRRLVLVASFVSGFVALALEVLWTRLVAEGVGLTIYVFALILVVYLLGIGLGSGLYRRLSRPERDTITLLGACIAGEALLAVATVVVGSGTLGVQAPAIPLLLVLPATILMGYAFPLSARLLVRDPGDVGSSVGLLYACNTAGSILGSFAAAFILAALLGTNRSILLLGAASLVLAGMLLAAGVRRNALTATPVVLLAIGVVAASSLDLPLTRTITDNGRRNLGVPSTHREDNLATVDASGGAPADRRLYVGGVTMTTLTVDTKLMVYLPRAMRPDARDCLVIAFGMGSTYRSSLILGMHTDAVELSPSVPQLMGTFFPDAETYLQHPQGRVIIGDGRNYVRLTTATYDVIAIDPPPPVETAGTVVLYTQEFMAQSKARLNPGGIVMLWIPYQLPLPDFKDHVRTFRSAFKHTELVLSVARQGVYMFGSDAPLDLGGAGLDRVFNTETAAADLGDAPDLASTANLSARVLGNRWLLDGDVDAFVGPGPLITDDRPRSEYYLWRRTMMSNPTTISENLLRAAAPTSAF
jgi:spermidine synthase